MTSVEIGGRKLGNCGKIVLCQVDHILAIILSQKLSGKVNI